VVDQGGFGTLLHKILCQKFFENPTPDPGTRFSTPEPGAAGLTHNRWLGFDAPGLKSRRFCALGNGLLPGEPLLVVLGVNSLTGLGPVIFVPGDN